MKKWDKKIDITGEWGNTWDDDNIHEFGKIVATRIKRAIPDWEDFDKWGFELSEIVESFDNICTKEEADSINKDNMQHCVDTNTMDWYFPIKPTEEFNGILSDLYDFADNNNIWIATNF